MTVYFIECAGRIKIGFTTDVQERMKGLSTGSAHDLALLCTLDGSVHYERAIHKQLKHLRHRGEWFEDCAELRDLMAALKDRGPSAIKFVEPPEREKYVPKSASTDPFESPLKPVFVRFGACTERYVGEGISSALQLEKKLGLPTASLANKKIGGFYTAERGRVVFALAEDTSRALNGLIDLSRDNDLDVSDVVPAAMEAVEKYERGLQVLFAASDPSALDLSGYS